MAWFEKDKKGPDWIGLISIIVSLCVAIITFWGLKNVGTSKTLTTISMIILIAILIVIVVLFFITYIIKNWRNLSESLERVTQDLNKLKEDIRLLKERLNLSDRVSKLEYHLKEMLLKKGKKGFVIDPRLILMLVALILLYLYLKSIGFIN